MQEKTYASYVSYFWCTTGKERVPVVPHATSSAVRHDRHRLTHSRTDADADVNLGLSGIKPTCEQVSRAVARRIGLGGAWTLSPTGHAPANRIFQVLIPPEDFSLSCFDREYNSLRTDAGLRGAS